jgi:hypothetical protein
MATPRVAITPIKVAQIPKVGADFEIGERNDKILRSLWPRSAQKPPLDNKNDLSKIRTR